MGFAGQHQLQLAVGPAEEALQPVRVVEEEVGSLVSGKTPREAQGEEARIAKTGRIQPQTLQATRYRTLALHMLAGHPDQLATVDVSEGPQRFVADPADGIAEALEIAEPALFAAGSGPEVVGLLRVPGRHVDAVRDMAHRDLVVRPPGEETLE